MPMEIDSLRLKAVLIEKKTRDELPELAIAARPIRMARAAVRAREGQYEWL